MKTISFFDSSIKMILPFWNKKIAIDHQKSEEILRVQYRPVADSVIAMAECMLEAGVIKDKRKKK